MLKKRDKMNFLYITVSTLLFLSFLLILIFIFFNMIKKTIDASFPIVNFLIFEKGNYKIKKVRTDGNLIINNSILNILLGNIKIIGFDISKYPAIFLDQKKFFKAIFINDFLSPFNSNTEIYPFSLHLNRYTSMIKSNLKYQKLSENKNERLFQFIPIFVMFFLLGIMLFFGIGHIEELKKQNMQYNINVLNEIIKQSNEKGFNYSKINLNLNETEKIKNNTEKKEVTDFVLDPRGVIQ